VRAAVAHADAHGIEMLSMRSLAQDLGVVPMALYKHVESKEELLDEMLASVIAEIEPTPLVGDWRIDARQRMLAARRALLGHDWSQSVLETRAIMTPAMLGYLDSLVGTLIDGGLSIDLTHHLMHALGNRMWGFNPRLFAATPSSETESFNAQRDALAVRFPALARIAASAVHTGMSSSRECDDQFEFEFALDLILDGTAGYEPPAGSSESSHAEP